MRSYIPLFAGYVFMFGSDEDRRIALATQRVVHALPAPTGSELLRDLRQVKRLIESQAPLTVEQRLSPGQRVVVRSGVLAGMGGTVLKRHNKTRLLVAVDFLQQGVSLEIGVSAQTH